MGKPAHKLTGHDLVIKAKNQKPSSVIPMFQTIEETAKTSGLSKEQLDSAFKLNIAGFQKGSSGEIYFTGECLDKIKEWAAQEKPLTVGTISDISNQITDFTNNFGVWIEDLVIAKVNTLSSKIDSRFTSSEANQKNILKYVTTAESSLLGAVIRMEKSLEGFVESTNSRLNTIDTSLKVLDKETKDSQMLLKDSIFLLKQVIEAHEDLMTAPARTTFQAAPVEAVPLPDDQTDLFSDDEKDSNDNEQSLTKKYANVIDEETINRAFKDYQDKGLEDTKCKTLLSNSNEMMLVINDYFNRNKEPMTLTKLSRATSRLSREERLAAMGYLHNSGLMSFKNNETGGRQRTDVWPTDALKN